MKTGPAISPRLGRRLATGLKVGLYGGSFDPAHQGHAHVAREARRRLGLDTVIWLVSPGNPLKSVGPASNLAERMAGARRLAKGRGMVVSDLETRIGARYSIETIEWLKRRFPAVRFVWIVGADAFADLHRWRAWRTLMRTVPVAILPRPGATLRARFARAARVFARWRLPAEAALGLAGRAPPAWIVLPSSLHSASSTALRDARRPSRTAVLQ